jgi:Protein  of unknown function (DUF3018)
MSSNTAKRVQKHRLALRAAGLRPVQIWVPDIRSTGFIEECRRQSALAAQSDREDHELMAFMDLALSDLQDL